MSLSTDQGYLNAIRKSRESLTSHALAQNDRQSTKYYDPRGKSGDRYFDQYGGDLPTSFNNQDREHLLRRGSEAENEGDVQGGTSSSSVNIVICVSVVTAACLIGFIIFTVLFFYFKTKKRIPGDQSRSSPCPVHDQGPNSRHLLNDRSPHTPHQTWQAPVRCHDMATSDPYAAGALLSGGPFPRQLFNPRDYGMPHNPGVHTAHAEDQIRRKSEAQGADLRCTCAWQNNCNFHNYIPRCSRQETGGIHFGEDGHIVMADSRYQPSPPARQHVVDQPELERGHYDVVYKKRPSLAGFLESFRRAPKTHYEYEVIQPDMVEYSSAEKAMSRPGNNAQETPNKLRLPRVNLHE